MSVFLFQTGPDWEALAQMGHQLMLVYGLTPDRPTRVGWSVCARPIESRDGLTPLAAAAAWALPCGSFLGHASGLTCPVPVALLAAAKLPRVVFILHVSLVNLLKFVCTCVSAQCSGQQSHAEEPRSPISPEYQDETQCSRHVHVSSCIRTVHLETDKLDAWRGQSLRGVTQACTVDLRWSVQGASGRR